MPALDCHVSGDAAQNLRLPLARSTEYVHNFVADEDSEIMPKPGPANAVTSEPIRALLPDLGKAQHHAGVRITFISGAPKLVCAGIAQR